MRPLSWVLAFLAAVALGLGGVLLYAGHTLFDSDGFADRAAAAAGRTPVRDALAGRLADAAIGAQPDLVALRPIVELAARGAVASAPFASLVRGGALQAHRAAFDARADEATFELRDAQILVAAGVRRLRPDAAGRIPLGLRTQVARVRGGVDGALLALAERADRARAVMWLAFAAAALLALGAVVLAGSARESALRLGVALSIVGAVVALGSALVPGVVASGVGGLDGDAVRAAVRIWSDPITDWALAACVVGLLTALAAASVLRPVAVGPIARRGWAAATAPPRTGAQRAARTAVVFCLGAAMVARPGAVLKIVVVAVGAVLLLAAFSEVLALAGGGVRPLPEPGRRPSPRASRLCAAVAALAVAVVAAAALAAGGVPTAPRVGRCNGHASLCDRAVDDVAFLGTHNAMAAAGDRGWLFAAQDAGIARQLDDGVRALAIDTHYGNPTPRGVFTDLSGETKSRGKLEETVGPELVATAERLRRRIGRGPKGRRAVFLCHAFCEVGATRAVSALTSVHRFLVRHPEEVVVVSIEDDTSAPDTAAAIRSSGLIDEVYRGDARPPWPTLRELIDRDERVIVLTENHAGSEPWIHLQPAVMQETPFHFTTAAELAAPASCRPNRGGTAGSLLLVNHWVDTSPAPRPTNARVVNSRAFLTRRLETCRSLRRMMPNVVAVDFYRQGDARAVVDELNDAG
jgi:hypothetical protein